jgi:hypothetical protein
MATMREHLSEADCHDDDLVAEWLTSRGFVGLLRQLGDCACTTDCDFMACHWGCADCSPGYEGPCTCGEHDYHIVETKPELSEDEDDEP